MEDEETKETQSVSGRRKSERFSSEIKKIIEKSKEYADSQEGMQLNPDEKMVGIVAEGLLRNEKKHGKQYCPCRRVTGEKEEDEKIVCPCIYHKDEVAQDGHCHCRLFFKK